MELHSLSDGKSVGFAILGDTAVFQAGHRGGQNRLKLISVRSIEENQGFVYVPKSLGGRYVVSHAWIKGPEVAVISEHKRIGVFNCPKNLNRKKEEQKTDEKNATYSFHNALLC